MNLVLIYGWGGDQSTWEQLSHHLRSLGHRVFVPDIPSWGTIDQRSKVLTEKLRKWFKGRPIHLIGHSMGGINARDLAASMVTNGLYILSVTTLGTPHYGLHHGAAWNLASLAMITYSPLIDIGLRTFVAHIASEFNAATPNNDDVLYLSWAGRFDEFVSVPSAKWGYFLGSRDLNHTQLPKSDMVEKTLPILQDWQDRREWSSCMPKIKKIQASQGYPGLAPVQEGISNVADTMRDHVLRFIPRPSLFWR